MFAAFAVRTIPTNYPYHKDPLVLLGFACLLVSLSHVARTERNERTPGRVISGFVLAKFGYLRHVI